jgi:isopentenyl-diphosphate delta-isomerase
MSREPQQKISNMPFTDDPNAASRKKDHINLAFKSQIARAALDKRFYYEPLLAAHPKRGSLPAFDFLGKTMRTPLWVSSMTGGTRMARTINHNLARACREFGMGMGLGSCRQLLRSDEYLPDFDVRRFIGDDAPLFANLGIAQLEQLLDSKEAHLIRRMLDKLQADGLIIHINPLQEWLQPEGDRFEHPPIETIMRLLDEADYPIIVKEVGQGFGYQSLRTLLQLPIAAIDFAANGGTNFAKLELLRSDPVRHDIYEKLAYVGHSAEDMVDMTNQLLVELGDKVLCDQVIISGGIGDFLDGYHLINKLQTCCIYGQASAFLKQAMGDYETLYNYVDTQVQGLELASAFLKVRE